MIHCAICDDDTAVTKALHDLMMEYSAELDCAVFYDPLALRSSLCGGQIFDLYLLDIIMPALTGLDLAREIRSADQDCIIIFLTGSDEFHRDAFEVDALQYLDKPVDKARLYRTLDRALRYIGEKKTVYLPLQTKEGIRALPVNQTVYVESFRHVLTFHLQDGCTIETLDSSLSLERLSELLSFPPFCAPYRGFIVNLDHVDCLEKFRFSMSTGDVIPIPQKQFSKVREQYADYVLARYAKGDARCSGSLRNLF